MEIKIPNNNIEERIYIIQQLLGDFLSIPFTIEIDERESDYVLNLPNKSFIIKDAFFQSTKMLCRIFL